MRGMMENRTMKTWGSSAGGGGDWRCLFCCHVRTGTILLGIWHLMLHLFALAVIAVVLLHPEMFCDRHMDPDYPHAVLGSTDTGKVYAYEFSMFRDRKWTSHDVNVGLLVTLCTFFITALMVYGAVKGNPGYLMPFFCLQVFDFCIATLSVVGYFTFMPDARQILLNNARIPFRDELIQLNEQWLSFLVLMFFVLLLIIKAYFIGVVWSCYKFLVYHNAMGGILHYIETEPQVMMAPPDYDSATKDPRYMPLDTPPPPYIAVNPPPPYSPPQDQVPLRPQSTAIPN